jgi:hypothetical protein
MSNVRRLGQECWLVDNVKFASGQRSCCQKRRLLKPANMCIIVQCNVVHVYIRKSLTANVSKTNWLRSVGSSAAFFDTILSHIYIHKYNIYCPFHNVHIVNDVEVIGYLGLIHMNIVTDALILIKYIILDINH